MSRLSQVRTSTGEIVTLAFSEAGVDVISPSPARRRAAQLIGTGVLLGFGVGAVGASAENGRSYTVGNVLWIVAAIVLAVGVFGGSAAWVVAVLRERGARRARGGPSLQAGAVRSARSSEAAGTVTVTVATDDGTEYEFSTHGPAGRRLAANFAQLLRVAPQPATR